MVETYPYEQLDGRRFQRLIQSLVAKEFPKTQCLSVTGQDGGRDVIVMREDSAESSLSDYLVFQVKFREQQASSTPTSDEIYEWLVSAITKEIPKVERLRERGVRQYIIATNASASAHLDVGLRDRFKAWLKEHCPVPALVWWRDDIDARLAANYDLVFKYMLFTGPESVRFFLESALAGDTIAGARLGYSRRHPAITALLGYIAEQYRQESVLRFSQADDTAPLFDSFVDVPLTLKRGSEGKDLRYFWTLQRRRMALAKRGSNSRILYIERDADGVEHYIERSRAFVGAADLFLDPDAASAFSMALLEGAPGQGKSTLTQYLCQIYRAMMLNRMQDLSKLPQHHKSAALRLPLRVELRHLATWLSGADPWRKSEAGSARPVNWTESLEGYIAAHITHANGGLAFSTSDLVAILEKTPTLLVLDGLDEVPDVELSAKVVEAVNGSINRLLSLGCDLQVIITSRPASFSASWGFSEKEFCFFGLLDLTRDLIDKYTDAWIVRRDLPDERADELKRTLADGLRQSHVAELARNPMQLAILIWLVYVKGRSLPEQRTELYESYMSTFLDREANKSAVVAEHRKLLLDIHGFLGWILHARSESGQPERSAGDIDEEELKQLLVKYLESGGHPTTIVAELFKGVQRVFVLVSRIIGRFEFEVQPLREFFAARYLYKTSPHSTSALPAKGTRPDRLEALIRNPYWLNVARFFCGSYDKGELADLSRRLEDLCKSGEYSYLSHPRVLIARLLRDHVTGESPRDTKQLARAIADSLGLRVLSMDNNPNVGIESDLNLDRVLPADGGLAEVVERLRDEFVQTRADNLIHEYARLLRRNDEDDARVQWWLENLPSQASKRTEWIRRAVLLGVIQRLPIETLRGIFEPDVAAPEDWYNVARAGRIDVACLDSIRLKLYLNTVAHGVTAFLPDPGEIGNLAHLLSRVTSVDYFFGPFGHDAPLRRSLATDNIESTLKSQPALEGLKFLIKKLASISSSRRSSPNVLSSCAEDIKEVFGECWISWRLAIAAAAKRRMPLRATGVEFTDRLGPLEHRALSLRNHAHDLNYWQRLLEQEFGVDEILVISTAAMLWAPAQLMPAVIEGLASRWDVLTEFDLHQISEVVSLFPASGRSAASRERLWTSELILDIPQSVPASLAALAAHRCPQKLRQAFFSRIQTCADLPSHGAWVAAFLLEELIDEASHSRDWSTLLSDISDCFLRATYSATASQGLSQGFGRGLAALRGRLAINILTAPSRYPLRFIHLADATANNEVVMQSPSLRVIAREGCWFDHALE